MRHREQPSHIPIFTGTTVHARKLAGLPLIVHFLRRLGVRNMIDRLCPPGKAEFTYGHITEVLVASRLTAPHPLSRFDEWAEEWAVQEFMGISAADLNDDRLGRTLDELSVQVEALKGSLTWKLIKEFGVDCGVMHWDLSSLQFFGDYDSPNQSTALGGPEITYGYGSEGKQVQVGFAVTEDGGIPAWAAVLDGQASQVKDVVKTMEGLRKAVRRDDFILVGDTKMVSKHNLAAATRAKTGFVAPEPSNTALRNEWRKAVEKGLLKPLVYVSEREQRKSNDQRTQYEACEQPFTFKDPETKQYHTLRRIIVRSSEEQEATRRSRTRQIERLETVLEKISRNAGKLHYETPEKVQQKAFDAVRKHRLSGFYKLTVTPEPGMRWERDEQALAHAQQLDGVYSIVTNLSAEKYDIPDVFTLYKRQHLSERRFGDLKGPVGVRPVFLKNPNRIEAMLFIVYLALLIYSLIEREVRRNLTSDDGKMVGLYPENRRARPTARTILNAFRTWYVTNLTFAEGVCLSGLSPLNDVQKTLLQLLGMDPDKPPRIT